MKKWFKRVSFCFLLAVLVWFGTLAADRQRLHEELIRLHIVAASNTEEHQALKLRVRDAVVASLSQAMEDLGDVDAAKAYLQDNLEQIREIAQAALQEAGCADTVRVYLSEEAFDAKSGDGITLPAGVYEALRIVIGEGQGENWWCVVFPYLFDSEETISAGAGFPDSLDRTLRGEQGYELRFLILDVLGKLENFLHEG